MISSITLDESAIFLPAFLMALNPEGMEPDSRSHENFAVVVFICQRGEVIAQSGRFDRVIPQSPTFCEAGSFDRITRC